MPKQKSYLSYIFFVFSRLWTFFIIYLTLFARAMAKEKSLEICLEGECNLGEHEESTYAILRRLGICNLPPYVELCNFPQGVEMVVNHDGKLQAASCAGLRQDKNSSRGVTVGGDEFNRDQQKSRQCLEDRAKIIRLTSDLLRGGKPQCAEFRTRKTEVERKNIAYIKEVESKLSDLINSEKKTKIITNLGLKYKLLANLQIMIAQHIANCGELALLTEARILVYGQMEKWGRRIQNFYIVRKSKGREPKPFEEHSFCVLDVPDKIPDINLEHNPEEVQKYLDELASYASPVVCDPWFNGGTITTFRREWVKGNSLYGFGSRRMFYTDIQAVTLYPNTSTAGLNPEQKRYVKAEDEFLNSAIRETLIQVGDQITEELDFRVRGSICVKSQQLIGSSDI